jgi:hypothetical protein
MESLHVSVVATIIRRFITIKMSLRVITKLHGAMNPLSCHRKGFLPKVTMFKYIKLCQSRYN